MSKKGMVELKVPNLDLCFPADKWTIVAIVGLFSLTLMICSYLIFVAASVENVESVMERLWQKPEKTKAARIDVVDFGEETVMAPIPKLGVSSPLDDDSIR